MPEAAFPLGAFGASPANNLSAGDAASRWGAQAPAGGFGAPAPESVPLSPNEKALSDVLVEGALLSRQTLDMLKGVRKMLRAQNMQVNIGELAMMFKFLTPDQLLAALLVSRELVSPQQIAALGRKKQELAEQGQDIDLEKLLEMYHIVPREQLDEIRAEMRHRSSLGLITPRGSRRSAARRPARRAPSQGRKSPPSGMFMQRRDPVRAPIQRLADQQQDQNRDIDHVPADDRQAVHRQRVLRRAIQHRRERIDAHSHDHHRQEDDASAHEPLHARREVAARERRRAEQHAHHADQHDIVGDQCIAVVERVEGLGEAKGYHEDVDQHHDQRKRQQRLHQHRQNLAEAAPELLALWRLPRRRRPR